MKHLQQTYGGKSCAHVALPPMKNNDNISMLARSASCFGLEKIIITGQNKIDSHISRDLSIDIEKRNSILPVILDYKKNGFLIAGLEQSNNSVSLYDYEFPSKQILFVVGNETKGMSEEIMKNMDVLLEIPLLNSPFSLNVAVAASICFSVYASKKSLTAIVQNETMLV